MPESDWTVETLRLHLLAILAETDKRNEQRFTAQESAVAAALTSTREAIAKAERATELRFDSVNEFRSALTDQTAEFIRRTEVDARLGSLNDKIAIVTAKMDKDEGRGSGLHAGWGYLVGAVGVVGTVVAMLMRK